MHGSALLRCVAGYFEPDVCDMEFVAWGFVACNLRRPRDAACFEASKLSRNAGLPSGEIGLSCKGAADLRFDVRDLRGRRR